MVIRTDLGRLTINAGSSSLKVAVFRFEPPDMLEFTVSVAEIGRPHPPRQWGGRGNSQGPLGSMSLTTWHERNIPQPYG